ncbi:TonB-dependent receptor [Qipengyuania soli]|uniref:TonB-dependent receptor n=1 Tax=Qipengyuania soli TaxID=2782568 RepID=A0A7S8F353_9SPHN|nr:TonB-dependent receptor [Qipengyuania soli]QPC98128.1 TonB-dependent receptor [Qipengyuania soli]
MRKFGLRHTCAIGALAVSTLLASPAFAQDQGGEDEDTAAAEDRIVVTGSYIRGTPEDAALPVDVLSNEELQNKGISSPLELIKELPSVGSVLGDTNQFSTAAQGFQGNGSINLRGLGATRTLVLVNGKRTIQAPGDGFSDTNFIPMFALQQVEILKDGAAATYGSDAIAGVANFITRKNFDGVEVAGDWTFIDGSDGNYNISALVGKNFGDVNLLVGAGWQHRSELATTARSYTSQPYDQNASGYSALATPGLFAVTYIGNTGVNTILSQDKGCNELGGYNTPPVCRFTYIPFDNITEDEDRYQVYAQADADLSDKARWHASALWAKTDLESLNYSPAFPPTQGPNGSGFVSAFTTSVNNPAVAAFLTQQGLPQSGGANGTLFRVTNVYYRPFGFIGNPRDEERGAGQGLAKNNAWRINTGFEFDIGDNLVLDLDGTYWRSARTAYAPGIIGSRLQAALNGFGGADCTGTTAGANGCQWFNPFVLAGPSNPSLDIANPYYQPGFENDPDLVAWLQVPNGTFQREEQWIADAVLSGGTGFELPGGEVAFAVGAQYRKNNFISRPLDDTSNLDINPCFREGDTSCVGTPTEGVGPFIFLGGTRPTKLDQSVYALFTELQLPILDNLELTAAIRYEDYGDPIGSTINPKAAVRFEATDWLTLRGSIGTTFRGPLASNVDPNFVTALQGLTATGGNYKSVDIYGNPDLKPETALTYNLGFIVNTGGLTFSADFWTYDFKDQIVITPADAIASYVGNNQTSGTAAVDCSSELVDLITFSGNACTQGTTTGLDIARVRTQYVNGPDVKVRGIDFAANYDIEAGFGVISIGGNATWNIEYKTDDFYVNDILVTPAYDAVGFGNYFRDPGTLPEWRANGYVNLNTSGLNLRYSVNYIDSVFDERCTADPCFAISGVPAGSNYGKNSGSYTQHDLVANYTLPITFAEVQLTAAVLNIFDEEPAQAYLPLGYNPFIGNGIGRNYRIGLRTKF